MAYNIWKKLDPSRYPDINTQGVVNRIRDQLSYE
jgi:hypothetical protein